MPGKLSRQALSVHDRGWDSRNATFVDGSVASYRFFGWKKSLTRASISISIEPFEYYLCFRKLHGHLRKANMAAFRTKKILKKFFGDKDACANRSSPSSIL